MKIAIIGLGFLGLFPRRLRNALNALRFWKKRPRRPVLVYQMGKVASSSVYFSLKNTGRFDVYHVHRLNPRNIRNFQQRRARAGTDLPVEPQGRLVYEKFIRSDRVPPTKIIALVREPIGRNISAFFQNLHLFVKPFDPQAIPDVERLIPEFFEKYDHDIPLTWFDDEIRATTGIDVYQHPFPHAVGSQVIDAPPYHLLVMRHDLDDRKKETCIADFLGLETFRLSRANESASKAYSAIYKEVTRSIRIPDDYADRMLDSKYTRHFYSPEEIRAIRTRWTSFETTNPR